MAYSQKSILILLLSLFVFNQGCISFRGCHDNIEGKYFGARKGNIINWLELKNDGTYYHFYENNGKQISSSGTWKKVDDGYCKIELTNWKNYNEKGFDFDEPFGTIFYINNEFLDRTPDGNSSSSFKKEIFNSTN